MRVLHQAPPPAATSVTRSPSRASVLRNSAAAAFARWAVKGARWMSSKKITNVRPGRRRSLPTLVETRGRGAGWPAGATGISMASKLTIVCGTPFS